MKTIRKMKRRARENDWNIVFIQNYELTAKDVGITLFEVEDNPVRFPNCQLLSGLGNLTKGWPVIGELIDHSLRKTFAGRESPWPMKYKHSSIFDPDFDLDVSKDDFPPLALVPRSPALRWRAVLRGEQQSQHGKRWSLLWLMLVVDHKQQSQHGNRLSLLWWGCWLIMKA